VGTDDDYSALGPGLHVLVEPHPLKRAGHIAAHLGGDLCATLPQVVAAIDARSSLPALEVDDLGGLEELGARLAAAQRVVDATHDRAAGEIAERLLPGAGAVAVHPDSIRARAASVAEARGRLAEADAAIAAHDAEQAARRAREEAAFAAAPVLPEDEPEAPGAPDAPDTAARLRSVGAIVVALGLGLVLVALDVVPLWLALIPTLVACLWSLRQLQPDRQAEHVAVSESTSLLREMAQATDEVFGARRAVAALDDSRTLLVAQRTEHEEALRVAERAWSDLAGPDVEVDDVEAVVRRFDPQHHEALALAEGAPSVRAATTLVASLRERWEAAWAGSGCSAPEPAGAVEEVRRVAELLVKPVVLVGPAVDRAEDLALAVPSAPVIVLDGPIE
jgi:hypothetical protein